MICEVVNDVRVVGLVVHTEDQVQRSGLGSGAQLKHLRENREKNKTAYTVCRGSGSEFQQKLKRSTRVHSPFADRFLLASFRRSIFLDTD